MLVIRPEDTSVPDGILNERERITRQEPLTRHSDSPRDVISIRRTLEYMDIGPDNLPEHSTVNVKISPSYVGLYGDVAAS
jgi:hypothetical protein